VIAAPRQRRDIAIQIRLIQPDFAGTVADALKSRRVRGPAKSMWGLLGRFCCHPGVVDSHHDLADGSLGVHTDYAEPDIGTSQHDWQRQSKDVPAHSRIRDYLDVLNQIELNPGPN
jgi:hypothetical protein